MSKKICAIFFCFVIGFLSITMALPLMNRVVEKISGTSIKEEKRYVYYGEEQYPFKNETSHKEITANKVNSPLLLRRFNGIKNLLTDITTDEYPGQINFVLAKKFWDKATGMDMTTSLSVSADNPVVDLGEGRLSYIVNSYSEENVNNLIEFGKKTEKEGRNFLLFCTPFKIDDEDIVKSGIYENKSIEWEKEYVDSFRNAGLHVVSATEEMDKQGLIKKDLFFKTDHHWLPQTALWGNKVMCDYLNKNMGFSIDTSIFNEENYSVTYPGTWLGSQGKQVTEAYCDEEPFPVVSPKYDSDITAFLSIKNATETGRIEDVLYDWSILKQKDIYTRRNYDFYSYGNLAYISIHNNKLNDGRRVLLVKRSFADSMVPSLAACVENLDVIDLRYFNGSLETYIEETNPDTVIAIYGVGEVAVDGSYDFR